MGHALLRGLRNRAYLASLRQRFGLLPASFRQTVPGAIWLHAVSVGEVISAVELIRQLRQCLPRSPVFVSVTTLAGFETASGKLRDLASLFYAPVDYVSAVRRVLRHLQPSLVIVMETEIWPNLFRETRRTGAGLMLINGRISNRAIRRYEALRWFFGGVLASVDRVLAQSEPMRQRFLRIGASPERVRVGGNLKYDFQLEEALPNAPVRRFVERLRPGAVWIAASTMPPASPGDPDEEETVIAAFQQVAGKRSDLLLMLAPRKPEHFDAAAAKLRNAGVPFLRRSALGEGDCLPLPGALLLDSIGELNSLFSLAAVVFMGGTLVSRGGHNILEPALASRPIVSGPHLENFAEIAADFRAAGALVEVRDTAALAVAIGEILDQPELAATLGRKAQTCAQSRQGAAAMAAGAAREIFSTHVPSYRPAQPGLFFLWMLSRLWIWGGRLKRKRDLEHVRHLDAPVISIGNITTGGTGKTPLVLYVAEKLKAARWNPGILTRGYGRHSPHKHEVAAPGTRLPVDRSGDEPQIFLRAAVAPVGIGPDRWHLGRQLEVEFGVNVVLLDDGFQHARVGRRVDIVLVDALNPFGGGYPLPLGRLREPLEGLARAGIFVITRSDFGRVVESIEHLLRRYNPRAPIFHARVRPEAWVACGTDDTMPASALPYSRVAAFCGLGNPESFWCTLSALGLNVVDRLRFDDHHAYKPWELRFLSHQFRQAGAEAILTTEKDMLNLCEDCDRQFAPLPLCWLRIGVHVDREDEFLRAIVRQLRSGP
jgi:3-deoxy-D-manno-octulosonic-acid transferase